MGSAVFHVIMELQLYPPIGDIRDLFGGDYVVEAVSGLIMTGLFLPRVLGGRLTECPAKLSGSVDWPLVMNGVMIRNKYNSQERQEVTQRPRL